MRLISISKFCHFVNLITFAALWSVKLEQMQTHLHYFMVMYQHCFESKPGPSAVLTTIAFVVTVPIGRSFFSFSVDQPGGDEGDSLRSVILLGIAA